MSADKLRASLDAKGLHFGLFCCSYSTQAVEALAGSGYEFLILDTEHCPNDLINLHAQLLALAASKTSAVVRTGGVDPAQIKRLLDLGVQGLMIPNVETVAQARAAVECCHYAPLGRRGVAGSVRASGYGRQKPGSGLNASPILMVQAESRQALENIDAIAALVGVDAVFFGPNDLAADMGHLGQPGHPDVVRAIIKGIAQVVGAGKRAGILAGEAACAQYIDAGASIVALGSEIGILVAGADGLRQRVARQFEGVAP
jgi:2-keto-3-deoxy-L-rhamnonate aldolase RhmA